MEGRLKRMSCSANLASTNIIIYIHLAAVTIAAHC